MLVISLKPKAEEDLEHIFAYSFSNFGLAQAEKYLDKFDKTFTLLAGSPRLGKKRLLNIHIEVQSQTDRSFEQRMFTYFYRIFDKYGEPPLSPA